MAAARSEHGAPTRSRPRPTRCAPPASIRRASTPRCCWRRRPAHARRARWRRRRTPIDPVAGRALTPSSSAAAFAASPSPTSPGARASGGSSSRSTARVLIPRPETELLVELALELQPATRARRRHRLGRDRARDRRRAARGARSSPPTSIPDALDVARANAERLGLAERVRLRRRARSAAGAFDLLVANLPYVTRSRVARARARAARLGAARRADAGADRPRGDRRAAGRAVGRRPATSARAIGLEVGEGQAPTGRRPRPARGLRPRIEVRPRPRGHRAGRGRPRGGRMSERRLDRGGRRRERRARRWTATIAAGGVAVFPADGLYGLACDPLRADAIARLHALKGRDDGKPSAVLFFSPLILRELISSLGEPTREALGALFPGPVTLVVAQPGAPLSARLPRGSGAARASGSSRARSPVSRRRSSRPRRTSRASLRRRGSRTCPPRSSRAPTSRSTAAS